MRVVSRYLIMVITYLTVTAIITGFASVALGLKAGLVDSPDTRKRHVGDIPMTGGIMIFTSLLVGTFAFNLAPYTWGMLSITTAIFLLGLYDDFKQINPSLRLALHYLAGLLLASWGGICINDIGNLLGFGNIPLLWLALPLTALAVAGLSNAYNMIDGIDGLAASSAALPLGVLLLLASNTGHPMAPALLLLLVPTLVFLLFNLGPNTRWCPKMFLGDAGSVMLGFVVTASLILFSQGSEAVIEPVTALWLVTVPLMDMLATMLRRWRRGHDLMQADRSHLHHTLINRGLGYRQTLCVMMIYATVCAIVGLALEALPAYVSMAAYLALFVGHCLFVVRSDRLHSQGADTQTKPLRTP